MKPLTLKIFDNNELVPEAWKRSRKGVSPEPGKDFYVFNPTLARVQGAYVMTYRVVDEVNKTRQIATCKLDADLSIVAGSVTPLSDLIEFEAEARFTERTFTWHADPRYFRLGGDLYLLWNDGSIKPANHQFLLKIGPDGLRPAGKARLVSKDPHESRIEKNWQFFESGNAVYAIYESCPLHLLAVELKGDRGEILCRETTKSDWVAPYEEKFGHIRGGAQPVMHAGSFLTLAHSSHKNSQGKLVYHPCFYRFDRAHPFTVTHRPKGPFSIPVPGIEQHKLPKLNKQTAQVIYPCGLLLEEDRAVISFGINDESSAVGIFALDDVMNSMEPVSPAGKPVGKAPAAKAAPVNMPVVKVSSTAVAPAQDNDRRIPLFWWNAQGKRFDPEAGGRSFATGNVGDIASMLFVEKLSGLECRSPLKNERKLLSIGSILQNAANGDIVWGSGIKGSIDGFKNPVQELTVHAVRGPLTVDFLRRQGIALPHLKELFDPGCLIPLLYADELRATTPWVRDVCVIPHYKDDLALRQQHPELANRFISVDALPLDFVKSLLGSQLVISSSLHGIIFAEALGIPAMWLAPVNGEDELKYHDYYYGTGRYDVKRFTSISQALRAEPMELPKFRMQDYLQTFPGEAIRGLCKTPSDMPSPVFRLPLAPVPASTSTVTVAASPPAAIVQLTAGRPPAMLLTTAIVALRVKQFEVGVLSLYQAAMGALARGDVSLASLVDKTGHLYLGTDNFSTLLERLYLGKPSPSAQNLMFSVLAEAAQQSAIGSSHTRIHEIVEAMTSGREPATIPHWRILQAFLARKNGKRDEEARLLRGAYAADPGAFWRVVQEVYRFTVDLHTLNKAVEGIRPRPATLADYRGPLHVHCYPSFDQTNPYLSLLYKDFVATGHAVKACRKLTELEGIKPVPGHTNLLHIHWVSAFFTKVDAEGFAERASYVLKLLTRLKQNGFSLAWTIHNSVSHDSIAPEMESSFNRKLYVLVDWAFVHHPMAVQAIGWLPDTKKLHFLEHGSYGNTDSLDKTAARRKLGMAFKGPLLSAIGHLRDYKELEKCLPQVFKVLDAHPSVHLLVAGQIDSPRLAQLLAKNQRNQIIVLNRKLSPEELHLCIDATDFGLLSYRSILTSGSLIHWLSRGVPVIAPAKGTIPGYIVEGWNGFTYDQYDALPDLITRCLALDSHRPALERNALKAGNSMRWSFA